MTSLGLGLRCGWTKMQKKPKVCAGCEHVSVLPQSSSFARSAAWCNTVIFCHFAQRANSLLRPRSPSGDLSRVYLDVTHLYRSELSFSYSWKAAFAEQTSSKFLSKSPSVERHENLDSTLVLLNPSSADHGLISVVWCVCRTRCMSVVLCLFCEVVWASLVNCRATGLLGVWVGSCVLFHQMRCFGDSAPCDLRLCEVPP